MSFRLTYATMFDPPAGLHDQFDAALARVRGGLGGRHDLFLDGEDVRAGHYAVRATPIDRHVTLGEFAVASTAHAEAAMTAAQKASEGWRRVPVAERAAALRRVADVMEPRVYEIAAALALEVGKNRMEALGEAQETVDFFRHYADDFERHAGYEQALPNDPLPDAVSRNRSVMRPYGAWVVIAPFNFPLALAGGPTAAALVTGNTVVVKGSSDTPWAGRLLADCIRDAALPPGVFQYLSGSGGDVGEALASHPATAGITFTGSVGVGRHLLHRMTNGPWPRPCIAEMGGKNPCIVTARANLDDAAAGIVRSAYGMDGQKCSALSRLYVDRAVADPLIERIRAQVASLRIGDPCQRENWLGPVINERAALNHARYVSELERGRATLLAEGPLPSGVDPADGHYVRPKLFEAPLEHALWQHEMFVPILMLHRVSNREDAMRLANDTTLGLTAGFYGAADEVPWFQENIEAGVTYANRRHGATTGAWPGYQPFGGWKGSGSTGKAIASSYYLAQYMREQSRTVVEP
jgi:acyl-CoA reductase-like NAD-dependent aldehyde dehydrogenase